MSTDTATAPAIPEKGFSLSDEIQKQLSESFKSDEATPEVTPAAEEPPPVEQPAKPEKTDAESDTKEDPEPVTESTVEDFLGEGGESEDSDDDDVPDDVKEQGDKAITTWKDLKRTAKDQAKEIERLTKEHAELKERAEKSVSPDVSAEIEQLRAALEDRERVIAAVSVVDSQEYQQAISVPAKRLEDRAMKLVQDPETKQKVADAIFEPNLATRLELIEDACIDCPDGVKRALERMGDEVEALMEKREELFANSRLAKEEIDRNQLAHKTEETAKDKAARMAASETVLKNIVQKLPFVADEEGEILPEYKEVFEKGRGGITDETPLGAKAFAAYAMHLVPKMDAIIKQRDARIAEQASTIKAMKGASPAMGGGDADIDTHAGESLTERILRLSRQ